MSKPLLGFSSSWQQIIFFIIIFSIITDLFLPITKIFIARWKEAELDQKMFHTSFALHLSLNQGTEDFKILIYCILL